MSGMESRSAKSVHRLCVANWLDRERGGFYQESAAGPNRGKAASCPACGLPGRSGHACGAHHCTLYRGCQNWEVSMRTNIAAGSKYQPAYLPRKDRPGSDGVCGPNASGPTRRRNLGRNFQLCDVTFGTETAGHSARRRQSTLGISRWRSGQRKLPGFQIGLIRPSCGWLSDRVPHGGIWGNVSPALRDSARPGLRRRPLRCPDGVGGRPAGYLACGSGHLDGRSRETLMAP